MTRYLTVTSFKPCEIPRQLVSSTDLKLLEAGKDLLIEFLPNKVWRLTLSEGKIIAEKEYVAVS